MLNQVQGAGRQGRTTEREWQWGFKDRALGTLSKPPKQSPLVSFFPLLSLLSLLSPPEAQRGAGNEVFSLRISDGMCRVSKAPKLRLLISKQSNLQIAADSR